MARTPPGYYLHLIAWAQIGVVLRIYLAELFGSACPTLPWAPCLTSSGSRWGGGYFTDLPANILGSFLMGLFVSSDVLSNSLKHILTVEAPMAMLSIRSPLQEHMAFQVGLRTGLCGSLTTFASWLTQSVLMIVGGKHTSVLHHTQWVEALGALLIGTLAALSALVMGQHCALLLYHKLNPGAFIPYGSPAPEQNKLEGVDEGVSGGADTAEDWAEGEADGLGRRLSTVSSIRKGSLTVVVVDGGQQQQQQQEAAEQRLQSLSSFSKADGRLFTGSVQLAAVAPQHRQSSGATTNSSSLQQPGAVFVLQPLPAAAAAAATSAGGVLRSQAPLSAEAKPGSSSDSNGDAPAAIGGAAAATADGATAVEDAAVAIGGAATAVEDEIDEEEAPSRSVSQWMVDGFAILTILVLTGVSLWRIIQGSTSYLPGKDDPFSQEYFWWAILFGPLGCYARYYLSRYNGKLPGDWKWFPVGTFAANITACVIDYVMKVLPVRHPLDSVSLAVLAGVVGGVGGCLSTVSTWVVEVQRLLLSFPKTSHGYQYIGVSLGTALALGLLIYGVPVWTQ